jgi:hypothetical protein
MMKKYALLAAMLLYKSVSFAQIAEFNDISQRDFNGVFAIRDQQENVTGYYTYYELEREDKGMRLYEFAFTDKALARSTNTALAFTKAPRLTTLSSTASTC